MGLIHALSLWYLWRQDQMCRREHGQDYLKDGNGASSWLTSYRLSTPSGLCVAWPIFALWQKWNPFLKEKVEHGWTAPVLAWASVSGFFPKGKENTEFSFCSKMVNMHAWLWRPNSCKPQVHSGTMVDLRCWPWQTRGDPWDPVVSKWFKLSKKC